MTKLSPQYIDQVQDWVRRRLPQARHIERAHIEAWLRGVMENDPDRLAFHLRRLMGIGSSECAIPWLEAQGNRDVFGTARELALSKLMRVPPMADTYHTKRGKLLERFAMKLFLARNGLRVDKAAMEKIARQQGSDTTTAWRRATPDLITIDDRGRRMLFDIKLPEKKLQKDSMLEMRYIAQLHHIRDVAHDLGIRIDRMGLVSLTIGAAPFLAQLAQSHPETFQACTKPLIATYVKEGALPDMSLETHFFDYDPSISKQIEEACHAFWHDNVLQGKLPDWPSPNEPPDLDPQRKREITNLIDFYGVLKYISDASERLASHTIEMVERHLADHAPGTLKAATATMSMQAQYDGDRLADYLKSRGVDVEAYRGYSWDTRKMIDTLRNLLGERFDPLDFVMEGTCPKWKTSDMIRQVPPEARDAFVTGHTLTLRRKPEKHMPKEFVQAIGEIIEKNAVILHDAVCTNRYSETCERSERELPKPKRNTPRLS